jgi:hypothetical protein
MVSRVDDANGFRPTLLYIFDSFPEDPLSSSTGITGKPISKVYGRETRQKKLPERVEEANDAAPVRISLAPMLGRTSGEALYLLPVFIFSTR